MAWYNNIGDLWHDVSSIAQGHNPTNQAPPVGTPSPGGIPTGTQPFGAHTTGQTTSPYQTDDPTSIDDGMGDDSGNGTWDWLKQAAGDVGGYLKDHAGDILKTGGTAANAYLDYVAKQQAIAERKREFDAQNQIAQGNQGMMAASQLNRAPLADKGQYLALNAAAPTAFQPRDYTQGLGQIAPGQQAQGGAAAQLAANAAAAANYKPGMGGVNTDTLRMILGRIQGTNTPTRPPNAPPLPPGAQSVVNGTTTPTTTPPTHSTTVNYGVQQMTQDQWQQYLLQHPEMKGY